MVKNNRRILVIFPPIKHKFRQRSLVRKLFSDLAELKIKFIPFPFFPPFHPRMLHPPWIYEDDIEEIIDRWEHDWPHYLEYWIHDWSEWEYYWRRYERYFPEILRSLRRLLDKGIIENVIILTVSERFHPDEKYLNLFREIPEKFNLLHINLGPRDTEAERRTDISIFNYPAERDRLYSFLSRFDEMRKDAMLSKEKIFRRSPEPDDVFLGTASPNVVLPNEEFVVRFAAYLNEFREKIISIIQQESPTSDAKLDVSSCKWKKGTEVKIRLNSSHLDIENPMQQFKWNGTYQILCFDAKVKNQVNVNRIILKFDIAVEGLPIMSLRPEITLNQAITKSHLTIQPVLTEEIAPSSAFASYATKDKREVFGRIRSLQIHTGIDVFVDCLSIRPGEKWKDKIHEEICHRDIFWLFWSRRAIKSKWVNWEWRTALTEKTLQGIEPHPLEPVELAPPPNELAELQFGSMFEWYISHLKEQFITRLIKAILIRIALIFNSLKWKKNQ